MYSFVGNAGGSNPEAGVIRDAKGNLYGTVAGEGEPNGLGYGIVYKLDPTGYETVLHRFSGGADGTGIYSGVIGDGAGNLYGTATSGGSATFGLVYKINQDGQKTLLYDFPGASDGANPQFGVIGDGAGNLYGSTPSGGTADAGTVFKIDFTGHETLLYSFTGLSDGGEPGAVTLDGAGNLYGTTNSGGLDHGVVYKLNPSGQETVLYSFTGGMDGGEPQGSVIRDLEGNLYGTTGNGGNKQSGVVFKLTPDGVETVLYNFTGGRDGWEPIGGLTRGPSGNLYGTTPIGGNNGVGVVYEVDALGHETVIHSFMGGLDGIQPLSNVTFDAASNLYGTTSNGGQFHSGTVYKIDKNGTETVLFNFPGGTGGAAPGYGALVLDQAGDLYGTTSSGGSANAGVVYQLDPTGSETVLYNFTGGVDGADPQGGVIRNAAGNLYGTAFSGGERRIGLVFELKPVPAP